MRTELILSESTREEMKRRGVDVFEYEETDSTNRQAILYAEAERPMRNVLFVAGSQTAGRGRLGRSFISPEGGVYMTILTPLAKGDPTAVTSYAATVVADAVEELGGIDPKIKWVNDVYLGGRKLSGILAQGIVDPESGRLTHVALGIGVNVKGKRLAPEIEDIATSLEREGVTTDRDTVIGLIATRYIDSLGLIGSAAIAERYRGRSFLIGKRVTVHKPSESYPATVLGITDACELKLMTERGEEILSTGEVSVREIK